MRCFVLALALSIALPPFAAMAANKPAKVKAKHAKVKTRKPKKIKHR